MELSPKRCYCAFCRSERTVYRKRHLSVVDTALGLLASFLLMVLVWQDFDPRFLIFFAASLAMAEFFIQFRWRLSMVCTRCGFDPVLYKRDSAKAAAQVKAHLGKRADDPMSALAPRLQIPVIRKKRAPAPPESNPRP